jgi:predicted permease
MTARELWSRLTGLPLRRSADPDFDDEIATHLELAKADYLRRGVNEAEAQRLAAMKFGSVAAAKEIVWEQRQLPGIGSVVQDVRYAVRGMRKSPGFALTIIATLALGIALCSVMFSLLNDMLLRPIAGVPNPDQLANIQAPVPYPWFESYREHGNDVWTATAFIGPVPLEFASDQAGDAKPERILGVLVSPDYFSTLRVHPMLGRFFDPRLETPGASPTAVLTERFWRTHLNADPHVIGRSLRVNGHAVAVIGVGAPDFFGAGTGALDLTTIFIAATADPNIAPELQGDVLHRTTQPAFTVLLRLASGVTIAQAEARLDTVTRTLDKQNDRKSRQVRLIPAGTLLPVPKEARMLVEVFNGVLISVILGLTCANLGGLVLARGAARGREFAIRLSIGADRRRLIRQLLTESAILSAAGGLAAFVVNMAILRLLLLHRIRTDSSPLVDALASGPDIRAALFTFGISAVAAAGFGLLPALATTRLDLMHVMKANLSAGLHRYRQLGLRNAFVVCQVAAAMMLVLIMGSLVIGVLYGRKTDPGFDITPVSFFSVDPDRDGLTRTESVDVLRRLPERLTRVSGVESVSLTGQPPLSNAVQNTAVSVPSTNGRAPFVQNVAIENVGPGFFATLGAPVLRGTDFRDPTLPSEGASPKILPVAINQTAATELFGDKDPLGRRIQTVEGNQPDDPYQGAGQTFQVAAVVHYAPRALLMGHPIPTVFVPLTAKDLERDGAGGIIVVVRARAPVRVAAMGRELSAIDSRLTLFQPQTLQESLDEADRLGSRVAAFYAPIGLFGLVLACVGLAGVTAQTVQRRSREIGIRMALGAQKSQVLRLVMREGAVMVAVGAVIGYGLAWAFLRILSAVAASIVESNDPLISNPALTVGVPSLLIALAAIACYLPARRSASIDPTFTLRED